MMEVFTFTVYILYSTVDGNINIFQINTCALTKCFVCRKIYIHIKAIAIAITVI